MSKVYDMVIAGSDTFALYMVSLDSNEQIIFRAALISPAYEVESFSSLVTPEFRAVVKGAKHMADKANGLYWPTDTEFLTLETIGVIYYKDFEDYRENNPLRYIEKPSDTEFININGDID